MLFSKFAHRSLISNGPGSVEFSNYKKNLSVLHSGGQSSLVIARHVLLGGSTQLFIIEIIFRTFDVSSQIFNIVQKLAAKLSLVKKNLAFAML